jgi:hypothetical protein
VNGPAHNLPNGWHLSVVKDGKSKAIGVYTTPQQAADAADALK